MCVFLEVHVVLGQHKSTGLVRLAETHLFKALPFPNQDGVNVCGQ